VRIWEVATGKELSQLKVDYRVFCLSYAPQGNILAVGDEGGNINFFNSQGEKLQSPVRGHADLVWSVCFSPDGSKIASCSNDKKVKIWDAASREQMCSLNVNGRVDSIDFAPCGSKLAVACNNFSSYSVKIFSKEGSTGNLVCQSTLRCDSAVVSVSYSADGTKLAAGLAYPSNSVLIFDAQTNEQLCQLRGHRYVLLPIFPLDF